MDEFVMKPTTSVSCSGGRVYMDGIFDLFHVGHLEAIKMMKQFGSYVIIGVVSDEDATEYKRKPIINELHRVEMLKQCKYVDEVIFPCPMSVTSEFMSANQISLVVHGFRDEDDYEKQKKYFKDVDLMIIPYSQLDNTTNIIHRVKNMEM